MLNFAILGAGDIAKMMATTINLMNKEGSQIQLYAVAARDLTRAQQFAQTYQITKAYGSYQELAADPQVDLIYIATPHNFHYEQAKLCLEHGKNVLVEKPFTVNASQAQQLFELAEEKKLLITEGIWTRYQPMRKLIDAEIAQGSIGKVMLVTANLGYNIMDKPRLIDPNLAGGALLDVGIYTLNFAQMILGRATAAEGSAILSAQGVDISNAITLKYPQTGQLAVLNSSACCISNRQGIVYGTDGYLIVDNINNPQVFSVYNNQYQQVKAIKAPQQLTGFEYEVYECMDCLEKGLLECPAMPHDEILFQMQLMDNLRKQIGVKYPFE